MPSATAACHHRYTMSNSRCCRSQGPTLLHKPLRIFIYDASDRSLAPVHPCVRALPSEPCGGVWPGDAPIRCRRHGAALEYSVSDSDVGALSVPGFPTMYFFGEPGSRRDLFFGGGFDRHLECFTEADGCTWIPEHLGFRFARSITFSAQWPP